MRTRSAVTTKARMLFALLLFCLPTGATGCSSLFGCDEPREQTVRMDSTTDNTAQRAKIRGLEDSGWDCAKTDGSGESLNSRFSYGSRAWAVFTCTKC